MGHARNVQGRRNRSRARIGHVQNLHKAGRHISSPTTPGDVATTLSTTYANGDTSRAGCVVLLWYRAPRPRLSGLVSRSLETAFNVSGWCPATVEASLVRRRIPSSRMLRAAFTSRSRLMPHLLHSKTRSLRASLAFVSPQ